MKFHTVRTIFQPFKSEDTSDKRRVFRMKILVVVYGVVCITLSFLAKYLGAVLQSALTIFGVIGGPVTAVFTLGILVPYVNQKVIVCVPRCPRANESNF